MDIVDLSKARAYAATALTCTSTAADWILQLADEVESLTGALELCRRQYGEMKELARMSQAERDAAVAGLQELHRSIATMLREARHLVVNHPDPAASAAAMRILKEGPSDEDR